MTILPKFLTTLFLLNLALEHANAHLLTRDTLNRQPQILHDSRSDTSQTLLHRRQGSQDERPSIRHRSFKDTEICKTKNKDQKQITGYVTLPPGTLKGYDQAFPINTFFWFVEARDAPRDAPLTVWLNGGPGSTSMIGLFGEVGPCQIIEDGDRLTTEAREFGWDEKSNMLFIDQPVQTGFSYDVETNGVLEVLEYEGTVDVTQEREQDRSDLTTETRLKKVRPMNRPPPTDEERMVKRQVDGEQAGKFHIPGTFSSGRASSTTNTTASSSEALWQVLQVWVKEFPEYANEEKGLHIWTESYGGQFGPGLAKVIVEKNEMIKNDTVGQEDVQELPLKSLGIINGWIDEIAQTPGYITYLRNNPYFNEPLIPTASPDFFTNSTCRTKLLECASAHRNLDPLGSGSSPTTNSVCSLAGDMCALDQRDDFYRNLRLPTLSPRSYYDITANSTSSFPVGPLTHYLNDPRVKEFVGAEVNITLSNQAVFEAFTNTGDGSRGQIIPVIQSLLSSGIKVSLLYGDKDYICNYIGGEAVALEIGGNDFRNAGYTNLTLDSETVAEVREDGLLSFVRVFGAGHLVPAYAPEAALMLFERGINSRSLATGEASLVTTEGATEMSNGKLVDGRWATDAFEEWSERCFVRDIYTCRTDQLNAYRRGEGIVRNGAWYRDENERKEMGPWGYAPYGGGEKVEAKKKKNGSLKLSADGWFFWVVGILGAILA